MIINMFIYIFSNPTVIGAIIGAIVGAIASAVFAIFTEWRKFSKQKEGAKALIKSEISYSIELLEQYRDKYLISEIIMEDKNKYKELNEFYEVMGDFPILTNRNWLQLISFIPSIFNPGEITKINTLCQM